jgi:hypothetical protein
LFSLEWQAKPVGRSKGGHKHMTGNRENRDSLRCISRTHAFTNDEGASYGGREWGARELTEIGGEVPLHGATERARISRQNPELARDLPPLLLVPHAPASLLARVVSEEGW